MEIKVKYEFDTLKYNLRKDGTKKILPGDIMKIGLSSYSLVNLIESGEMTILDAMDFAKENGAEHIELVPFGYTLIDDKGVINEELISQIKEKSQKIGLPISNYAVLGDLLKPDREAYHAELERLKGHIDVAAKLGIKQMRHDVSSFRRPLESNTQLDFEREFPQMVESCSILADYAAQYGITTLVENHGFFVNGSDRVIRLVDAVGRKNFRMVVDTGNFACVDEQCEIALKKCLPYADMIHLKDFYIRRTDALPQLGGLFRCDSGCWFSTASGYSMLRGSILAQGDLDIGGIIASIAQSGFDGYVSIEFEGMEDPRTSSIAGLNAARYYAQANKQ